MRQHILYKDGDKDLPPSICDSNGAMVLGMCRTCGKAEIELEEPCLNEPWYRITGKEPEGVRFQVAYLHKGQWVQTVARKQTTGDEEIISRWITSPGQLHIEPRYCAELPPNPYDLT